MDLTQLQICVQKFHHDPEIHSQIHSNTYSLAIFLKNSLWKVGDTITISFFPMDDTAIPVWYSLDQVSQSLTPGEMDLEKRARAAASYEDAVKLIVNERVQPAVSRLNLKFVDSDGLVRVRFYKYGGSSSLIGTACRDAPSDQYTITFGWMDVGTIIHEFSHALGMLHEHQNPAGGIQWNREAVYEWAKQTQGWDEETTDENILDTYASNQITGSTFDPNSVMLYFFPAELTLNNQGTKQNLRYSNTDLEWLARVYKGTVPTIKDDQPSAQGVSFPLWKILLLTIFAIIAVVLIILISI